MLYRENPKNGDRLSALGFGCMRFDKDERETEKQVRQAIELGVNYFDTAYIYPGKEAALGRVLSKGLRERVRIATKLPPFMVRKPEDFDRIFATQLERLQTDHIEYYFIHSLGCAADWERLLPLGVERWIEAKKASGQIGSVGFSFHGGQAEFCRLIDAYGWDFCMIQLNYLDEHNQAGVKGLAYAHERGVPVMVMEPLRGGMLANRLPNEAASVFKAADAVRTPAEWGLRWVLNRPEVLTVLSGMNTQAMVAENCRIAGEAAPGSLTAADLSLYEEVKRILLKKTKVSCTGCGYCMPCPHGVDIPLCFESLNAYAMEKTLRVRFQYITYVGRHNASRCARCGACEKHCPQGIAIADQLGAVVTELERFPYKPARFVVEKAMKKI